MMPKPLVPPVMTAAQWAEAFSSGNYRDETCAQRPLEWFFEQAILQGWHEARRVHLNPPPQEVPDATSIAA